MDIGIYVKTENLGAYAKNVAKSAIPSGQGSISKTVAGLSDALRTLKKLVERAGAYSAKLAAAPKGIEWLLDNWYLAEREGKNAIFDLKPIKTLPTTRKVREGLSVFLMARAFVRAGQGEVTPERLQIFLEMFQKVCILSEKELSAVIPAIKGELVIYLTGICLSAEQDPERSYGGRELPAVMKNIFTSLRLLGTYDFSEILEQVNLTETVLRQDPAELYPHMDEETRMCYRKEIAHLAKKAGLSEYEAAKQVLKLSQTGHESHVGHYIFVSPLGKKPRKSKGTAYIGAIAVISLVLTILIGVMLDHFLFSALLLFPISEIVKNVVDFLVIKTVRPREIPRVEFKNGIPASGKTICVISALLSSGESAEKYARLLEEYRIANRDGGGNLLFGILADLPESREKAEARDDALIEQAKCAIDRLNSVYGSGFYLFTRQKTYNPSCGMYMGWERKRGAIHELVCLLRNRKTGLVVATGDKVLLQNTNFILTLDSDTRLNAGSAVRLVGAALHPLNIPVIDSKKKIVVRGSGILQPRISVELEAAGKSDFTKVFAGQGGIDPYGSATSDVYQDLFGRGSFTGKGLINVQAYELCLLDRFPENCVLSHDLLEGAFLKCAYMGDTEFTDGYPYKVTSYFDRMHRWTRGDWQNIVWLGRKARNARGEKVENPLCSVDKWKVFDNLRRSLVPISSFLAVFLGMFFAGRGFLWATVIAVLSYMSSLLISSAELVFRRDPGTKRRYHSTILYGFAGGLIQTIIRLMLLPFEAYVSLSAIVTALYRMTISKRNMLAWITAAESEKKAGNTIAANYKKMAFCGLMGIVLIFFAPFAAAKAVGIVWLMTPAYAYALSRELRDNVEISTADRMFLVSAAGDIWKYFRDFLRAEDNFLPPDNWQEQPANGIAHRTSPTNIGLAMLSALAAMDLNIISESEATRVIENMVSTIERLPKWNGHLYNWYDTQTLRPLSPTYVSTVDSGNYVGCMIAVSQALCDMGNYALAGKCDDLIRDVSFRPLYDAKRKLLYIGWDILENKPSEGWYDLMSSEARQASFIAIARGDIPRKHWRQLSRALVAKEQYSGMVSWTGTMFEYLMPNLLLPCYKNSLLYESMKFAIYAQKKAVHGIPWGISESAFYAFDPALSYCYKAHGVQALALKRKMGKDTVISPYSTFLALCGDLKGAVRNLKRLRACGAEGKYGFYEAIDFTPSRQTSGSFELVKSFMVHHLAMSLISIDNALCGCIMPKRFMQNVEMASFAELLQEKVPVGEVVLRQQPRDIPEGPPRGAAEGWHCGHDEINIENPKCCLLSNGAYSVLLSETGKSRSSWGELAVTDFDGDPYSKRCGVTLALMWDDEVVPLVPAPEFDETVKYGFDFSGSTGRILATKGQLAAVTSVLVPGDENGELRTVELLYSGEKERTCTLFCMFQPVLDGQRDYDAHPTFSRLLMEAKTVDGKLMILRRARGGSSDRYLCLASDKVCEYNISKMDVFGRGGLAQLKTFAPGVDRETISSPEFYVTAAVKLCLQPGKKQTVRFALAPSVCLENASAAADTILNWDNRRGVSHTDRLSALYKLSIEEIGHAMDTASVLTFPNDLRDMPAFENSDQKLSQNDLWGFGVSGDFPILLHRVSDEKELTKAMSLVREYALLRGCGMVYDLVFVIKDDGDYQQETHTKLGDFARSLGLESRFGSTGGIHFIKDAPETAHMTYLAIPEKTVETFRAAKQKTSVRPRLYRPKKSVAEHFDFSFTDNGFVFHGKNKLPEIAWSNVLTNGRFGYISSDAGTGHMWLNNARENKINRWLNDGSTASGTERLELWTEKKRISLFAAEDGYAYKVTFARGMTKWEKDVDGVHFTITAFVPMESAGKVFLIEADKALPNARIVYCTDLLLGAEAHQLGTIETAYTDGVFTAENRFLTDYNRGKLCIAASENAERYTTNKLLFERGEFDNETNRAAWPCAALAFSQTHRLVLAVGTEEAAVRRWTDYKTCTKVLKETVSFWNQLAGTLQIRTQDSALDHYMNGWCIYQVQACRLMARSSIYQCGGAYGFRDQLQDACAIITVDPEITRKTLIMAAQHQFMEGDVQHWWHPGGNTGTDKGVRTRYSDDLLWLPYALCTYVEATNDRNILNVQIEYITSPVLKSDEHERYEVPQPSGIAQSLLDHALKAIDLVLDRGTGDHGLCKILGGDWNDGMNKVGAGGKGESQWLTWFVILVLKQTVSLLESLRMTGKAEYYRGAEIKLRRAAEAAWDGAWYKRGYYDDGTPLGSGGDDACAIDSIAQSFSVFAGGDAGKAKKALESAGERLIDRENKLIKLFTPAFDKGARDPGYIKSYCPGFRENGGQYTHGAIWLARAMLQAGMEEDGWKILEMLLPANHDKAVYKCEPFVLAADVYANAAHTGRSGWTWYTGAAGWYYRTVREVLLGITVRDGRLFVEPKLPLSWPGFEAKVRIFGEEFRISVRRSGGYVITVNNTRYDKGGLPLKFYNNFIYNGEKM